MLGVGGGSGTLTFRASITGSASVTLALVPLERRGRTWLVLAPIYGTAADIVAKKCSRGARIFNPARLFSLVRMKNRRHFNVLIISCHCALLTEIKNYPAWHANLCQCRMP
jgi:hypothetical protein